jgi:hypothetical protein
MSRFITLLLLSVLFFAGQSVAEDDLAKRAELLKKRVAELNRELMKLEQDTLTPVDTQVVVFLAVDEGVAFALDSVELRLDDTLATQYLYSEQELGALSRGGVQRLYMGAIAEGSHQLQAIFNGKSGGDKYVRKAESLKFAKASGALYLELRVKRNPEDPKMPRFAIQALR